VKVQRFRAQPGGDVRAAADLTGAGLAAQAAPDASTLGSIPPSIVAVARAAVGASGSSAPTFRTALLLERYLREHYQSTSGLILRNPDVLEHGKYDRNRVGMRKDDAGATVFVLKCELGRGVGTVCQCGAHAASEESQEGNGPRKAVRAEYHCGVTLE